jgi:hypothetical protein
LAHLVPAAVGLAIVDAVLLFALRRTRGTAA